MKKLSFGAEKRPTIAFLTRDINGSTGLAMLRGAVEAAEKLGINLITFFGLQMGRNAANIAYKLCNVGHLDGILNWATAETQNLKYFNEYRAKPLVSLSLQIPEHPVVIIDCYGGTKELLTHLIKLHGIKKIAFIKGPEKHVYANERYKAYVDVHQEFSLAFDERRVTPPGEFNQLDGRAAVRLLFDERRLKISTDVEAVVATNDNVSIGVIEELRHRGVKVPQELAVIGLNSTTSGSSFTPPITSAAMPFSAQVEAGLAALLNLINGKAVDEKIILSATQLINKSCGCESARIIDVVADHAVSVGEKEKKRKHFYASAGGYNAFSQGLREMGMHAERLIMDHLTKMGPVRPGDNDVFQPLVRRFISTFFDEIEGKSKRIFLASLEEALLYLGETDSEIQAWQSVISIFRRQFIKYRHSTHRLLQAEDLFEQARVAVGEVVNRHHIGVFHRHGVLIDNLRQLGTALISTFDCASLLTVLEKGIKKLGIPSYYVCLYEHVVRYQYPDPLPEWSKILFAKNARTHYADSTGSRFRTEDLLPDDVMYANSRISCLVIPLIFNDQHIGYTVAEFGPFEPSLYTALAEQLATAIMGSILMEERVATQQFLEATLDSLKTKARVVSTNSQAIMNRVSEVSSATGEIAANERQISKQTEDVMRSVSEAVTRANGAIGVLTTLMDYSEKIAQITGMINDIADKTNILSLNANIQAARAGSAGKGFKVVADEIQNLSRITIGSTKEIGSMVNNIRKSCEETFGAVKNVINVINTVSDLSLMIRDAIHQQAVATSELSNSLIETATGSREIFEAIREVARTDETGQHETAGQTISDQLERLREKKG